MGHLILGIESSCDDTSVALVRDNALVDMVTVSSSREHNKYGGVVPEIAARGHADQFIPILFDLLGRNNLTMWEVTHIAYTESPGLIGCLLVGHVFAKSLALLFGKELIPVNHVHGHIFSVGLTGEIRFPHLALVVSGKTTALYLVRGIRDIGVLDSTSDNALGEVYDKVARELGLGYPGGPHIDAAFNPNLSVPPLLRQNLDPARGFSYSGIMSATLRLIRSIDLENRGEYVATIFQRFVVDNLVSKVKYWMARENLKYLTVSGGVAANSYLRGELMKLPHVVSFVDRRFSGDNAAMIAHYASNLI